MAVKNERREGPIVRDQMGSNRLQDSVNAKNKSKGQFVLNGVKGRQFIQEPSS